MASDLKIEFYKKFLQFDFSGDLFNIRLNPVFKLFEMRHPSQKRTHLPGPQSALNRKAGQNVYRSWASTEEHRKPRASGWPGIKKSKYKNLKHIVSLKLI